MTSLKRYLILRFVENTPDVKLGPQFVKLTSLSTLNICTNYGNEPEFLSVRTIPTQTAESPSSLICDPFYRIK